MLEVARNFFRSEHNTSMIVFLLVIVLLLVPYGFIVQYGEGWHYFQVYSAVWAYQDWNYVSGEASIDFVFPDPYVFVNSFIAAFFRYVFVVQLVRHHQEKTTKRKVDISAVLSQFPLVALFVLSLFGISIQSGGGITGPVPILLVLGLVIDHYWGTDPPVAPWGEEIGELEKKNL